MKKKMTDSELHDKILSQDKVLLVQMSLSTKTVMIPLDTCLHQYTVRLPGAVTTSAQFP